MDLAIYFLVSVGGIKLLKLIGRAFMIFVLCTSIIFIGSDYAQAEGSEPIILDETSEKVDVYPGMDIIKGKRNQIMVEDIISDEFSNKFVPSVDMKQKRGFFERENWLRFEVNNQSNQNEWLLEFAFPLIHELHIYVKEGDEIVPLY